MPNPSPDHTILISAKELLELDIARFAPLVPPQYLHFFFGIPGVAPYRLLAFLSTLLKGKTIVEIGVHNGWGSLALSYEPSNRVIGYDIDLGTLSPAIRNYSPALVFREGLAHEMDPEVVLSAPLIHFDAQHDGVYERTFTDFLLARGYRGLVLYDDIHLNPEMEFFWASIAQPKHDLTFLGHETGSGLVMFGAQEDKG